jgi:hypothetical protein
MSAFTAALNRGSLQITLSASATFADIQAVSLAQWQNAPTLESGHFDNLKFRGDNFRVWVSRQNLRDYDGDGTAFSAERLTVEQLIGGVWTKVDRYGKVST